MRIVNVRYFGVLNHAMSVKGEKVKIDGESVTDLINELSKRHGPKFRNLFFREKIKLIIPEAIISVNGKLISDLQYFDTELKNEDVVVIFFPIMGG